MVDPQTSRFWQASLQSGLIDAQGLAACWDGIPEEKREAVEHLDRRLARQAVQQGRLTLWQAQQVLAGRSSGFRVDRYLMLELIGHGGMGRVYLARDTRLNRLVALKILAPERMNNPRAIARFQREARVGAKLQHENLVRIYDFGESQGRYYLVMEYIEGKTIGARISAETRLAPAEAARLTRQIALGLEHAHRKGLIHRDVNPYNVMLTHDGVAKLADLGLAIDMAEEDRVTREGATVGTFDYVAPEQARHSQAADIRSDIYSLGCSLYHMISGQVPFPSPSLPEKLFSHQALEPKPLGEIVADVPPGLVELIAKMMKKQPSDRFETPLDVVRALEPFLEDATASATATATDSRPKPVVSTSAPTDAASASPESQSETKAETDETSASVPTPQPAPATAKATEAAVVQGTIGMDDGGEFVGSADFPVFVDLGPEPSLTESVNRAKPKPWFGGVAGKTPSSSTSLLATPEPTPIPDPALLDKPPTPSWREDRRFLVGGSAAALVAMAAVGFALTRTGPSASVPPKRRTKDAAALKATEKEAPKPILDPDGKEASIVVVDPNGEATAAPDLLKAMQAALGSHGTVELHNREPMTVQAGAKAITLAGRGTVRLRSAPGNSAVLKIDLKGGKPFLSTGPSVNLEIEDLTFEVFDSGPSPGQPTPPVVLALGRARLDRCALRTSSTAGLAGSRGVVSEGGTLSVVGCWFEGFDAAIEVRAMAGSKNTIRQTMMVPGPAPAGEARPGRVGWGVRVQFLGGGAADANRALRLEHCTFAGMGFLGLAGFSAQSPLSLVVADCAVQSDALIGWEPSAPDVPFNGSAVNWTGDGNQFDVSGGTWVVPGAGAAANAVPPVADLDAWSKLATERKPVRTSLLFPLEPRTEAGGPTPKGYAVKPTGAQRPGADPSDVGPRP